MPRWNGSTAFICPNEILIIMKSRLEPLILSFYCLRQLFIFSSTTVCRLKSKIEYQRRNRYIRLSLILDMHPIQSYSSVSVVCRRTWTKHSFIDANTISMSKFLCADTMTFINTRLLTFIHGNARAFNPAQFVVQSIESIFLAIESIACLATLTNSGCQSHLDKKSYNTLKNCSQYPTNSLTCRILFF